MKKNEKTEKTTKNTTKKVINKRHHKATGFFILALLMILAMLAVFFGLKKVFYVGMAPKIAVPVEEVECLKQGNTCDMQDIRNGIKVSLEDVLSDTEDTITLLYADNLAVLSNWSNEMVNFKGPQEALYQINKRIEDWSNIPYIKDYAYVDFGYYYYQDVCITNEKDYEGYDCSKTPGYKSMTIYEGQAEIVYHLPLTDSDIQNMNLTTNNFKGNLNGLPVRGRMITYEEVIALGSKDGLPVWLLDHLNKGEFYWTMSSSPMPSDDYVISAYSVYNNKGKAVLAPKYVMYQQVDAKFDSPKGHLRPVITILKNK